MQLAMVQAATPGENIMKASKLALLALLCAFGLTVNAQSFPSKPVRVVVPYPPGGGVDTLARPIADRLGKLWGTPVIVDNKPGAGTLIGADAVAKAEPDAHTLLLTSDSTVTSNPHLYAKMPFDPIQDLAPVTQLIDLHQMVVVHPSLGATSFEQLIATARAKPGTLNYGSYGSGSQPNLLFEALKAQTGIRMTHVPYKGLAPALAATLAGEVQMTLASAAVARGHIAAGKLKPLAIGRPERLPDYPQVPTLKELGYADIEPKSWFGLLTTAGSPAAVVQRIQKDVASILQDPAFREREIIARGNSPVGSTPQEFAAFIAQDLKAKARLIKLSGAKVE